MRADAKPVQHAEPGRVARIDSKGERDAIHGRIMDALAPLLEPTR